MLWSTETGRTGSHLWEFLRRLLTWSSSQSEASERVIEWQNRSEGVFRIVNSSAVARLWGEQKHNRRSVMTYEKLSRALRSALSIHSQISTGQIVGERGGTAFPFRFWRGNAVPLAYTTAVGGQATDKMCVKCTL